MWSLSDYKVIQKFDKVVDSENYFSITSQREYDCEDELIRSHAQIFYAGNMGAGNSVYSFNDIGKWYPVSPKSTGKAFWNIACEVQQSTP